MANFNKRPDSGGKRPRRSSDNFKKSSGFGEEKEGSKKSDYKSKRSFTRNKSVRSKKENDDKPAFGDKPFYKGAKREPFRKSTSSAKSRPFTKRESTGEDQKARRVKYQDFEEGRGFKEDEKKGEFRKRNDFKSFKKKDKPAKPVTKNDDGLVRLNKYLSNAGIASRREADVLIQSGAVKVNGVVVDQLGYKIKPGDKVTYGDSAVKSERKVYLLLNKPKDYITTLDDPQGRKTVIELIAGACRERVYPVGRLDRNTTGLLLLTNDGEMTTRLTHPKYGVKKVYHVSLNKGLKPEDFKAIIEGVELEDGMVKADDLAFVGEGKKEIGIEIHSGRNRVVRRIFEHLGYDVLKLDRVVFAGLTKKDLPRGKYRFLTSKEVGFLHMIG